MSRFSFAMKGINKNTCKDCLNKNGIPPLLALLCKRVKLKTLTFNHFKNAVVFYERNISSNPPNPKIYDDVFLRTLFYRHCLFFGKTKNTLSRDKILSYNYKLHNSIVKLAFMTKYGVSGSSRGGCGNCNECTDAYSGCSCACISGCCSGLCQGGVCNMSDIWWC